MVFLCLSPQIYSCGQSSVCLVGFILFLWLFILVRKNQMMSFLDDFLQDYELLEKNQFDFQHNRYTVNITAFVYDGPARQFLKSIKSHNAYYGCERYLVRGRWEERVVFVDINCSLRRNQS